MCKKIFFLVSLVLVLSIAGNGWAGTSNPTPANGAVHEDTWANLGWEGAGASFDVYFSDNLDNVKDGTEDTFQGYQATKVSFVGFPGIAFPAGLVPGTLHAQAAAVGRCGHPRLREADSTHHGSALRRLSWEAETGERS